MEHVDLQKNIFIKNSYLCSFLLNKADMTYLLILKKKAKGEVIFL